MPVEARSQDERDAGVAGSGEAQPRAAGEGHPSYVALLVPGAWGLVMVSALADVARKDTLTTIWLAFGTLACLAAILVILGKASHRPWVWALGVIPASFLGPLAGALLFVPAIRHALSAARFSRPRFERVGQTSQGAVVEKSRRTEAERPAEPTARPAEPTPRPAEPTAPKPRPHHGPPASLLHLIALLVGCIAAAAAIFIGLLTWAVLAGVHKFTNHQAHVLILISVVPAAGAALVLSWRWTFKGAEMRRRATVALPAALTAQAVLWGAAAWLWAQKWN